MDIYYYLNSFDVEKYCREMEYVFNALECAFIINKSEKIDIRKKHQLYIEIMKSMDDITFDDNLKGLGYSQRYYNGYKSLFEMLDAMIGYEDMLLDKFFKGKSNAVYMFGDSMHSSYEKMIADKFYKSGDIPVYKAVVHFLDDDGAIHVQYNKDKEIISIYQEYTDIDDSFLDDFWVYIPTPFKEGDLLVLSNYCENAIDKVMVLSYMCYEKEDIDKKRLTGQSMDMTAYGYFVGEDGNIYYECIHNYHDLSYYKGALKVYDDYSDKIRRDYRLLQALSSFMQKKIDLEMLLIANNSINAEKSLDSIFPAWDLLSKCYYDAGIGDVYEKREMIRKYEHKERLSAKGGSTLDTKL